MPSPPSEPRLTVVFTPDAVNDVDEAFAYITSRNRRAARCLLTALRAATEQLRDFPCIGAQFPHAEDGFVAPGVRFVVVEPYLLFYRVGEEAVVVLRILHSRRDGLGELLGG
jgi:toxin ParE1/3/4